MYSPVQWASGAACNQVAQQRRASFMREGTDAVRMASSSLNRSAFHFVILLRLCHFPLLPPLLLVVFFLVESSSTGERAEAVTRRSPIRQRRR